MTAKTPPVNALRRVVAKWLERSMNAASPRWTQTKLADVSGVSRPTIWGILKEKTDSEPDTWLKLAQALKVDVPAFQIYDPTIQTRARATSGASVKLREPRFAEADGPVEGPGWAWDDEDELDEQLRTLVRNVERTVRGMVTDTASIRDLQLVVCRGLMRQCEIAGKPVPEALHRIYNEVIAGDFR